MVNRITFSVGQNVAFPRYGIYSFKDVRLVSVQYAPIPNVYDHLGTSVEEEVRLEGPVVSPVENDAGVVGVRHTDGPSLSADNEVDYGLIHPWHSPVRHVAAHFHDGNNLMKQERKQGKQLVLQDNSLHPLESALGP